MKIDSILFSPDQMRCMVIVNDDDNLFYGSVTIEYPDFIDEILSHLCRYPSFSTFVNDLDKDERRLR